MDAHNNQLYLLEQHSESFEIWSTIKRINTEGKSLIMKLGPDPGNGIIRWPLLYINGIEISTHKGSKLIDIQSNEHTVYTYAVTMFRSYESSSLAFTYLNITLETQNVISKSLTVRLCIPIKGPQPFTTTVIDINETNRSYLDTGNLLVFQIIMFSFVVIQYNYTSN